MAHEVRTEEGEVKVGTEACFQNLVEGLSDPDPKVRRLAVCGLAASGEVRCVEHVARMLHDPDEEVRTRAALALGKMGHAEAAPPLVEAATGPDAALRRAAILALGELDAGLDVLADVLRRGEPAERTRAAIALGETHDVGAIEPLTLALKDQDATVRARAAEALEKIRESRVF
ncbi:MAG: HEAT repeat domain-containing protein [Candidatus Velamenicoccus archaeovorus]